MGDALVVLESSQRGHTQLRVDIGHELADSPPLAPAAADVQQAETADRLSLHSPELVADDLVAGAHGEDHAAEASGSRKAAVCAKPVRGEYLREVLTPAEQVDVTLSGDRLVCVDPRRFHVDAAQPRPPLQDEQVAPVTVRAEQIRVYPHQPEAAGAARGGTRRPGYRRGGRDSSSPATTVRNFPARQVLRDLTILRPAVAVAGRARS